VNTQVTGRNSLNHDFLYLAFFFGSKLEVVAGIRKCEQIKLKDVNRLVYYFLE
jgi:hypothetical protein